MNVKRYTATGIGPIGYAVRDEHTGECPIDGLDTMAQATLVADALNGWVVIAFTLEDFPLTDEQREQLTNDERQRLGTLFSEGLGSWTDAAQEAVIALRR